MELHFESDELVDWLDLHKVIDESGEIVPCTYWPDGYHPDNSAEARSREHQMAKALCDTCPVRLQCLDYALKWAEQGVWGGTEPHERRRMKRMLGLDRD